MPKVAIQGGLGSYSHMAADKIFGQKYELIQNTTFKECFHQCAINEVDYAVIPFENSTHGSVHENYDLLTKHGLYINRELYLKINFHLISLPGANFEDIKELYSHQVSMSQIRSFLDANLQIEPIVYLDNGRAVEHIRDENNKHKAAAAGRLAAEIYGMKILKENIHDNPKNYTRFFVISKYFIPDPKSNKTSIQFELKHEPGTLMKALKVFSDRNIGLMKIESRPILNTVWEYLFYIDLLAGIQDMEMQRALEGLKHVTLDLKILGSYQNGEYIET